jgi:hypothetical protein
MYPGTTLGNDLTIYSESYPREADNLIAVFQVMDVGGGGSVSVKAYTKNSTDTTWPASNSPVGTTATLSNAGDLVKLEVTGALLKEEVRFRFEGTGLTGKWVHFRLVEMVWYDKATV